MTEPTTKPTDARTVITAEADLDAATAAGDLTEAAHLMTAQLDVALHGSTWARPASPRSVWLDLLAEVQRLAGRDAP